MDHGVVINPVIKNKEHFNYWLGALSFYDNVKKDGIILYSGAEDNDTLIGKENSMPLLKEDTYTTEYIDNLPEGERAELIDGKIYNMTAPTRMHQRISTRLASIIDRYISDNNGKCEVYSAPFAVFLNKDNKTYVEPDVSVICDPNKLDDRGCNGAPDWIIEIVSPSSQRMDYLTKLLKYRTAGVREYWIVNPAQNTVTVYKFEPQEDCAQYSFEDDVPVGIYEGFAIKIGDLI